MQLRLTRWLIGALLILVGLPTFRAADDVPITFCTERALDEALTQAADGVALRFDCSGQIPLTYTKVISKNVTLDGSNQSVTLSGRHAITVLSVSTGAHVTFRHLVIKEGRGDGSAGGINNRGDLIVENVTFTGNEHAIVNFGTLTVSGSSFIANSGDGIYNSGALNVSGSVFIGNGRGIDNGSGIASVGSSTFIGNRVLRSDEIGAGIANSGALTITDSLFIQNEAPGGGGALANHRGGRLTLRNSTLLSNLSGNCFGPLIDDGNNRQFPGVSCGESIPSADSLILAFLKGH